MPWDQTTFLGYIGEINSIAYFGFTYMVEDCMILLFFVSICMHHQAFHEIFEHSINNHDANSNNSDDNQQFIFDLIRFHVSVKE